MTRMDIWKKLEKYRENPLPTTEVMLVKGVAFHTTASSATSDRGGRYGLMSLTIDVAFFPVVSLM